MRIRKIAAVMAIGLLFGACAGISVQAAEAPAPSSDYEVEGGRLEVSFDSSRDEALFDLYTEFDKLPFVMDGQMYAWVFAEQKIILKDSEYTDVDVSVDISTINDAGKFDSGIYVQASGARNSLNGINAWEVNVEHVADTETYSLKLHRFESGAYKGAFAEVTGLHYEDDTINLRVVVKGGTLYAFLNRESEPTLSYAIGEAAGAVGLRNYYSPNMFDNFAVIGGDTALDTEALTALVAEAEGVDKAALTAQSRTALEEALAEAQAALGQTVSQYEIDRAAEGLRAALDGCMQAKTFADLTALLAEAAAYTDPSLYTANSWASFAAVRDICAALEEGAPEQEISYWCLRLRMRIDGLIAYEDGGAE